MKRKLRILVPGFAVAATAAMLILQACSSGRSTYEYSGTIETREIQVGSKVGGRVTAVLVDEGQFVKAGNPLVCFESDELQAQRDQWHAKVDQATADLERMQRGNRPEEISQAEANAETQRALLDAARKGPRQEELEQAQADYAAAKADATSAESSFRRLQKLVQQDVISKQEFDDARARRDATAQRAQSANQHLALLQAGTRSEDLRAAEERYRQAQEAAQLARKGFRKEDIEAAKGRLAEAHGHLDEIKVRLREAELTAPADAVVQVVSVRPGDLVPPGRIVVTMLETSQLWVKVYIPETELGHVSLGQKASVKVDSFSNRKFDGHIEQISSAAEFLPRNVQTRNDREHQVFGVKVRVDNPDGVLKPGMSATVRLQ